MTMFNIDGLIRGAVYIISHERYQMRLRFLYKYLKFILITMGVAWGVIDVYLHFRLYFVCELQNMQILLPKCSDIFKTKYLSIVWNLKWRTMDNPRHNIVYFVRYTNRKRLWDILNRKSVCTSQIFPFEK